MHRVPALARSQKADVSIATVTRFAKAVGCQDVRELKLRLAQAAAVGQRFLRGSSYDETDKDDPADSLAARIFDDIQTTLAHNRGALRARRLPPPPMRSPMRR